MTEPAPNSRQSIVLIGYRGAGKTSVGRVLAKRLNRTFEDTDDLVTAIAGMTIAKIFAQEGEAGFRRRESQAVEEAVRRKAGVISVGGGAVLDEANVKHLKSIARVVFLHAPPEVLWERISSDSDSSVSRPAFTSTAGLLEVKGVLAFRFPIYREIADIAINTDDKSIEEIADEIVRRLAD